MAIQFWTKKYAHSEGPNTLSTIEERRACHHRCLFTSRSRIHYEYDLFYIQLPNPRLYLHESLDVYCQNLLRFAALAPNQSSRIVESIKLKGIYRSPGIFQLFSFNSKNLW